ncbi:Hypothetical predicted protein [Olea europaea subsp. europaea]|uniref:Uncharacterized protein n=1 Tax=Olea europaea subsp. europaea TaxID=158383 RepID=A0A8S0PC60_OLEEU|nr:Hypothetical predicted protein [Olea europaea subsp. europaea]
MLNTGINDLSTQSQMGTLNWCSIISFQLIICLHCPNPGGFFGVLGFGEGSMNGNPLFFNRSKILKPLDDFASIEAPQPTLFQKMAALSKNLSSVSVSNLGALNLGGETNHSRSSTSLEGYDKGEFNDVNERKRKNSSKNDGEDFSIDGSNLNSDSDDQFMENSTINEVEESDENGENISNVNSTVTCGSGGDHKCKKKSFQRRI